MKRKKLPPLSPSETEILRIVWQLHRATVQDVCDNLPSKRDIAYATVQTLLRRLEKKGYLKHLSRGKAHVFFPSVKKEAVIQRSVNDFIERLFGGDPIPILHHLAEHKNITADDIESLRKLVNKKK